MPLIDNTGQQTADAWTSLPDDAPATSGPIIVSLTRLLAESPALPAPLGVLIPPDAKLETLALHLPHLALVAIAFPKFRDGRGFTLARTLREQYHFTGELRATGHPLPDQFVALLRCGITTVDVPATQKIETWRELLTQRGVPAETPLPFIRRSALPYGARG
jgi:uncharacterized protein (DUF934 family)